MTKRARRASAARKPILIGETYLDTDHHLVVTAEEHEIVQGRRTGRVIVLGTDSVQRFPRRWFCREEDLAEAPPESEPTAWRGTQP